MSNTPQVPTEVITFVASVADCTNNDFSGMGHVALKGNCDLQAATELILQEADLVDLATLQLFVQGNSQAVIEALRLQSIKSVDPRAGEIVTTPEQQVRDKITAILSTVLYKIESICLSKR